MLEHHFDRIFLIGDYNINVSAGQPSANLLALQRIHTTFNLTVLNTTATRITEQSSTTIDLMVTDYPQFIKKAKVVSANTISDHEAVYLIADLRVPDAPPRRVKVRNFRRIDQLQLQADFQARDMQYIYQEVDVDVKTQLLTNELNLLLDQHAPERTITVRDKRIPWITDEIQNAIALRNLAYSLYVRNPNRVRGDVQWQDYISKKSRTSTLIAIAKKQYADSQFGVDLSAKQLWCNLRREGVHNNAKLNSELEDFDAEQLNQFFAEGHQSLHQRNAAVGQPPAAPADTVFDRSVPTIAEGNFGFRRTNSNEVCSKIYEIGTNAKGTDGIPISFIKLLCPFILPLLTHLFNTIIEAQTFPSSWKRAIVTPIPKSSNPTSPKDFRPISVLPAISKVLEKILMSQITEYLDAATPTLLAKHQSGYRKNHSTTTALVKVTHDVVTNFDENRCTVMVLVDFSLAFNCVRHGLLGTKLRREFGFSDSACKMISSFLEHRSQTVNVGDATSSPRNLIDGTPQGSCLSALLFSIYINSLPGVLNCEYHLYADDLQIYISGPSSEVDRLIESINADLLAIERWSTENHLSPNPKKTQAIIFSKTGTIIPQNNIRFCGETITLSNKVTNLGLIMDVNLKWTDQVNELTRKVYCTLRTFRRFQGVLSLQVRKRLAQSVLLPFFLYCDVVFYPSLTAALKSRIHRCFKSMLRFVFGLRRRDSTREVRHTIVGCDLPEYYHRRVCCFMFGAYYGKHPDYIKQYTTRGRNERARSFVLPIHTTSARKSVLIYGASEWNSLPLATRQQPTLTSLKAALQRAGN